MIVPSISISIRRSTLSTASSSANLSNLQLFQQNSELRFIGSKNLTRLGTNE